MSPALRRVRLHATLAPLLLALVLAPALSGCAGLLLGGAAMGAAVALDRRDAQTVLNDRLLSSRIQRLLREDEALKARAHVNVATYGGTVLLTGETPSEALRTRAETLARQGMEAYPSGRLYNELALAGPSSLGSRLADAWISGEVRTALLQVERPEGFDPLRVSVTTERGIVYLMGLVTAAEVEPVVEQVRRIRGVQRVVKLLEVVEEAA